MLNHYETVFITTPVLSEIQVKEAVEKFKAVITENGGNIEHEEAWGLRQLAYPCLLYTSTYDVLVVSENGYGKRSSIEDYRITNRGGKGVKTINMTEKTGNLIALLDVTDEDNLMIINKSGLTIRLDVSTLRVMGRNTQDVYKRQGCYRDTSLLQRLL